MDLKKFNKSVGNSLVCCRNFKSFDLSRITKIRSLWKR